MRDLLSDFKDLLRVVALVFAYTLVALFLSFQAQAQELKQGPFPTNQVTYGEQSLRVGQYTEQGSLRGCVLFLEGLGDSILNHEPLYRSLAQGGYRTITFDYFGQGGSSGSMNDTRVEDAKNPYVEIGTQARFVWGLHPECASSKKLVIGWSTGGLAAYKLAVEKWADAVVLLAPGIYPNKFVGRAARQASLLWKVIGHTGFKPEFYPVIGLETLTRDLDRSHAHVEGVKPSSPTAVPLFALNLIVTSMLYRETTTDVPGLALLSGDEDTYVDRKKSEKFFKTLPNFKVHSYPGALHELDNELEPVRVDVQKRALEFFNSIR